jgi:hypothetical protein
VARDPLAGIARVVVDGTNLLHAQARLGGRLEPPSALIARMRAGVPAPIPIDVIFDGPPAGVTGRLASGTTVHYAGRRSADQVIVEIVAGVGDERAGGAHDVLVVTDDAALRDRARDAGARTVAAAWLLDRAGRSGPRGTSFGNRRPPR